MRSLKKIRISDREHPRVARIAVLLLLLCSNSVVAQQDKVAELPQKLQRYYVERSPLDLHLFFNQPIYSPGDTAYFKMSFLSARSRTPISGRAIINVDLYRQNGERVHHQKVLLKGGYGGNQIVIPQTFEAGVYVVVAYNEWMLNRDQSNLFFAELTVSNGTGFLRKTDDSIRFYSEGGTFVAGVRNRVVVTGAADRRVSLTDASDSILSTALLENGMGTIVITPEPGQRYSLSDGRMSRTLPAPSVHNIHLAVVPPDASGRLMQAQLYCPDKSRREEGFYFVVSGYAGIYYTARIGFRDGDTRTLFVPQHLIPTGIACATLFRYDGQVEASRLFMAQQAPGHSPAIQIAVQPSYVPRDSIRVMIKTLDPSGKALKSMVGVTVIDSALFAGHHGSYSLKETLLARRSIAYGGLKEFPVDLLNPSISDEALITEKWNDYDWSDVVDGRVNNTHLFKTNIHFSGRVIRDGPHPPADTTIATFFLQHDLRAYDDFIDEDGAFNFALYFDFHGQEDVFYNIEDDGRRVNDARLEIDEPPNVKFPSTAFAVGSSIDPYAQFAQRSVDLREAYTRRSIDQLVRNERSPHELMEDEIDGVDISINLDEYLIFPTMEETLREIIPGLNHRWRNKKHTVRVRITDPDRFPDEDPIYFIDGVLTGDTDYFMTLDPAEVASIKVITSQQKLANFGNLGKNGVVLVETKIIGNADRVPRSKSYFEATGLTDALPFHAVASHEKRRTPDFRASLFWAPVLYSDAEGKTSFSFCAADNPGRFVIIVDGITENGEPVYAESTFDVSVRE